MAGINFALRRLVRQDNAAGLFQGYVFSSLITAGPWLFTSLALATFSVLGVSVVALEQVALFRLIVIYNFSFSMIVTGPITMIITRYISDKIYERNVSAVPGAMLGAMSLLLVQLPFVSAFYFHGGVLPDEPALAAVVNYTLISAIWVIIVFLSTLKDYWSISLIFGLAMLVASVTTYLLHDSFVLVGYLWTFNLALAIILFCLLGRVLVEYPYPACSFYEFTRYFKTYWELALCGLLFNLAIWGHIWVMWHSPYRQVLEYTYLSYPYYDTSMFLAFLTVIPAVSVFFVNIETSFFKRYIAYYRDIQNHCTYDKVLQNQKNLTNNLIQNSRTLAIFQAVCSLLIIFTAPQIFNLLGIDHMLLGMFRIGTLGALFHVLCMLMFIVLFYFDLRKEALWLHALMVCSSIGFTLVSMNLGFSYYGYGYFFAMLLTFTCTFCVTVNSLKILPFKTFIQTNPSVRHSFST